MSDLDESYVSTLSEALTSYIERTSALAVSNGNAYASNSPMANDLSSSARPESIVTASSIALQLIEYSAEHVTAFVKTINEPIEPLACWTCIRSMLESCAISTWLLNPNITAEERVARAFAIRYEGMDQQLKFGRCTGQSAQEIQSLENRIDAVEQTAIGLGYPQIQNRHGKRDGIAIRMPGATDIIKSELNEESMYRLLSGVAHGHSWAIMQLGFKPSTPAPSQSIGSVPVHSFEKSVFVNGLADLLRLRDRCGINMLTSAGIRTQLKKCSKIFLTLCRQNPLFGSGGRRRVRNHAIHRSAAWRVCKWKPIWPHSVIADVIQLNEIPHLNFADSDSLCGIGRS